MTARKAKRTLTIGAREANQRFSHFLREVEQGTEVVITKNGREVARLTAAAAPLTGKDRQKAIAKMVAMMRKGLGVSKLGRRPTRDEMHER